MRPEARLEVEILRALGHEPDVLILKNEVGSAYYGALRSALCGPCASASNRFRFRYGAGGVGAPDLLAVVAGRFLGLELKAEDGRVSPEQFEWHAAAARRGARVEVVRSVEQVRAAVEGVRR